MVQLCTKLFIIYYFPYVTKLFSYLLEHFNFMQTHNTIIIDHSLDLRKQRFKSRLFINYFHHQRHIDGYSFEVDCRSPPFSKSINTSPDCSTRNLSFHQKFYQYLVQWFAMKLIISLYPYRETPHFQSHIINYLLAL